MMLRHGRFLDPSTQILFSQSSLNTIFTFFHIIGYYTYICKIGVDQLRDPLQGASIIETFIKLCF